MKIDLKKDPPPDLGLEIDITRSSMNRLAIYTVIGIPEIWRQTKTKLIFLGLEENGEYAPLETSRTFPGLTPADLLPFLKIRRAQEENSIIRQFRQWIREVLMPRRQAKA